MLAKKYIGFLIVLFTAFGAVCKQPSFVPNQEVVLQFNKDEISSQESQNIIAIIKEQLNVIGVHDIVIHEGKNQLKITYYSEVDVEDVRLLLEEDRLVQFGLVLNRQNDGGSSFPIGKEDIAYNLDVYEISNILDTDSIFLVNITPETKTENIRVLYFKNVSCFDACYLKGEQLRNKKKPQSLYESFSIAKTKASQIIPEVRAGPSLI